jgi:hypothetical protein
VDEERKDQDEEQGEQEEMKDLEVSDEQAEDVKGGLGQRARPED